MVLIEEGIYTTESKDSLAEPLRKFAKDYTIELGTVFTQQQCGYPSEVKVGRERLGVANYIDIGKTWGTRADQDYARRLGEILEKTGSNLVYDRRSKGWAIEADPDRACIVQALYKGYVFDHDYCEHPPTKTAEKACELGLEK